MKNRFFIVLALLFAISVCGSPANAQTTGTTLEMRATWDDGTPVQGTVTLGLVHAVGADTIIATEMLSSGRTSVTETLETTSLYNITLASSSGATLLKFPVTTALINPQNLQQAEIHLVLRKADNTLKSAHVSISMDF